MMTNSIKMMNDMELDMVAGGIIPVNQQFADCANGSNAVPDGQPPCSMRCRETSGRGLRMVCLKILLIADPTIATIAIGSPTFFAI